MDERAKEKRSNIAHPLAKVDCEGENMEKKLSNKRKKTARDYKINEVDHSLVIEEKQGKKMKTEKILGNKNKRTEDEEYETNRDNPYLAKSNVVDPPLVKSYDDQHLVRNNEGEDNDQGKKMKKKKLSKESKHKEYNESKSNECEDDDQGKKMKAKKKLTEDSKLKEYNVIVNKMKTKKNLSKKNKRTEDEEHETNGGDPYLAKSSVVDPPLDKSNDDQNLVKNNEGEDDDQGKKMKKKKKKKKMMMKKLSEESKHKEYNEFKSNECEDDDHGKKIKKKKKKKLTDESKLEESNDFRNNEGEDGDQVKVKKKKKKKLSQKSKSKENHVFNSNECDPPLASVTEVNDQGKKMKKKKKKAKAVTGESTNPARDGTSKPKRVTFTDQEEVCCDGLVRGKRFTPEEDEKIKAAVFDYIKSYGLGDEGLDMVLHCKKHPQVRGCWKEITKALPSRPYIYVYERAHILLECVKSKWTPDELEFIRKAQEQHGSDWRPVAEALGKSRNRVKDAWRRVKCSASTKRGHWSQEEYQNLFNLVNQDLRMRASENYRKSKHGMLRDNIGWEAISNKLSTRSGSGCCYKWYMDLTSPMVANGEWCDTDDYRMLNALYTLDACCKEEVDWDNLLEHRSGNLCRKRWGQMVQRIGEHVGKSFAEQVEILAKRFCPDLLEAREAFDNKPVVC